jgi:lycopene beta-cyclase
MAANGTCDLAIVGGGLAGGLTALAVAQRHPDARLLLIESGERLGGNHLWSFFDGDMSDAHRLMLIPMVTRRWTEGHEVRFPSHARTLDTPYNSIASTRFHDHILQKLGDRVMLGAEVKAVAPDRVALSGQRSIKARVVIDARGGADLSALSCGWQKFVGQELELTEPHRLTRPMVMDATVAQRDGYRFVYVLPFDERTVFVEDTYYSDTADIDTEALRTRITDYVRKRGWRIADVKREESGALPVVMGGDFGRFWPVGDPVGRAGTRAGLFHPTTGYSLPDAVRFAHWFAEIWPVSAEIAAPMTRAWAHAEWRRRRYYRLLDRMLFRAATDHRRRSVFEHFYRLPSDLIERFYAGQSTLGDKLRILSGKPPVPIRAAMRALIDTHHS